MYGEARAPLKSRSRPQRRDARSGGRLFFNPGPLTVYPVLDFLLVSFYRSSLRPLGRKPHRMQQTSDMIHMVSDTKMALDHLSHARTCPQVVVKASRFSPFEKQSLKLLPCSCAQLRRASRSGFCANGFYSSLAVCRSPTPDASSIHTESLGDFDRLVSLLKQFHGFHAAALQLLWASMWSHRPPPTQSIGHYLCSCQ